MKRLITLTLFLAFTTADAQTPRGRERELGIAALIGGTAGPLDAITDVAGVEVGHTTLVRERAARGGQVRAHGVPVVQPAAKRAAPVSALVHAQRNGERTGTTLQEAAPRGADRDHNTTAGVCASVLQWQVAARAQPWGLPWWRNIRGD